MEGLPALALEAIFPTHCAACGADGSWCCAECLEAIEIVSIRPCPSCGSLKTAHDCDKKTSLDALVAAGFYHDPRLRALIHGLKYQNATCVLSSIADVVRRAAHARRDPWPWAGETALMVQPVIGSPDRIRARGFDQAEFLAEIVKREIVPWASVVNLLERKSSAQAQAELEVGPLRSANVMGAFSVIPARTPPFSAVIIVDDVFTTGATMHEAARALRDVGVDRIYGFALALGA